MIGYDYYFLTMGGYKPSLLKLRGYKHSKQPLKDFIRWLLSTGAEKFDTMYLNNRLQCRRGSFRSLGDIFRICKYYYPDTTFTEVRRLLLKTMEMRGHFCSEVEKRVYSTQYGWKSLSIGDIDEFGFPIYYYNGPKKCKDRFKDVF